MKATANNTIWRRGRNGVREVIEPGTVFDCTAAELADLGVAATAVVADDDQPELPLEPAIVPKVFAKFDHDGDGRPGGSKPKGKGGRPKKAKSVDADDLV